MDNQTKQLDMETVRARLKASDGKQFWRSLGELSESDEFVSFLEDEFPQQARPLKMEMDRRQFMILSGASLALAGLAGCRALPQDKLVPYVKAPEELVPGIPVDYASAYSIGGYARGILVTSNDGHPTKIEGNPDHPSSLGKTDALMQGSILNLYDPDRLKNVINLGEISTWESFLVNARPAIDAQKAKGGSGLRILTETVTSPTLNDQIQTILRQFPQAQWHQYEPVNQDNALAGAKIALGAPVNTIYQFDKADRIVSLDGDFLTELPGSVRYAQDFSAGRRVGADKKEMNRLYAVESTPTLVGAKADHRLPLKASQIEAFARSLAANLGVAGVAEAPLPAGDAAKYLTAVAEDLQTAKGRSIVVPGARQSPAVHALCHAMNSALGNVGTTVLYTAPIEANPVNQIESIRTLSDDMKANKVEVLFILGGNPIYNAPADIDFANHLKTVPLRVHLSLHDDETSALCQWNVPDTHYLEMWSDLRGHDGAASVVQPLISPLYESRSAHEMLAVLLGDDRAGYDIVRDYWRKTLPAGDFEKAWSKALNDGVFAGTAAPTKQFPLATNFAAALPAAPPAPAAGAFEVIIAPDQTIWDGRYANNGWLQELPKTLSKVTWDNVVQMNPNTMEKFKVAQEDLVAIEVGGKTIVGPAWPSFGHPEDSATVTLGYGHTRMGQIANGSGFDVNPLRTSAAPWLVANARVSAIGGKHAIATTENHHIVTEDDGGKSKTVHSEGDLYGQPRREIIGIQSIEDYKKSKKLFENNANQEDQQEAPTLYPEVVGGKEELPGPLVSDYSFDFKEFPMWAMTIDMNTCIGCNACTIACQAENNIATVGKDQVMRGREMHWIRIDRYYRGDVDNPQTYFQPLACQHCEKAPCEPVCPVAATVHSHDGLNQMVYNRCLGTKYCSNNCPYKVRRFNFLNYSNHFETPVIGLSKNPDVTVRGKGVMEKCTYCVQRISRWRIEAKKKYDPKNPQATEYKDGEVVTACQQACPTNAIQFGDLRNKEVGVGKAQEQSQNYYLLEELNTRPRTSYLAHIRNPNPALETVSAKEE